MKLPILEIMLPGDAAMGMLILITVFVSDVAFMIFCLVTKSRQDKLGSIIGMIGFATFALFTLASVIQWSFRWVGLAALLFIWAAGGLWRLRQAKTQESEHKIRLIVFRTMTVFLMAFVSVTPVLIFPQYKPLAATGPYPVASVRTIYTDPHRIEQFADGSEHRRVNVSFWFPQDANDGETYPLIVFSHGGLGTENSNESLYCELASHGYVVASIGHPYHALWTKAGDGRITFLSMEYFQELQSEDAKRDKQQSYRYYQKWMETRTGDINFVIATIEKQSTADTDGVYGLVDVERIGVMGHSLGGSAALAIPRLRDDIDAVIALESPFLYDITGVENGEFVWIDEAYPIPVLNIYSDSSWTHLSEWAQYAENFALLFDPSTVVHNLYLPGAGHLSLTDLSLASPLLVRILEGGDSADRANYLQDVNQACLEFFNRYLKNKENS